MLVGWDWLETAAAVFTGVGGSGGDGGETATVATVGLTGG